MKPEAVQDYLARRCEAVNAWLDRLVPRESVRPEQLHRAMRYSLLGGGKRLRPVLALAAGEACGAPTDLIMPAACAIEMIHTYSLIHDDLPAMDNDDMRRGRPTCHRVFGEGLAILAGDALLTRAFEVLASDEYGWPTDRQVRALRVVARAAGTVDALIGGQAVDLESEGLQVDPETVDYIHRAKTGAMIEASVLTGAVLAGAGGELIEVLGEYGRKIGLAFQIADDVLDVTSTSEQLGKTAGKDEAARKATYPAVHGLEKSIRQAETLVEEAIGALATLSIRTEALESIALFIVARKS